MKRKTIGILLGDPSGIGPELISKILFHKVLKNINIVIIGEKNILNQYLKKNTNHTNIKKIKNINQINFKDTNKVFLDISKNKKIYPLGKVNKNSGLSVLDSINKAVEL